MFSMVYVISKFGKPLMSTKRHGMVRHWLKSQTAKVVSHCPFTIQLLFETESYTQPLSLGVDSGYANVGISVVSEKEEVFSSEVKLRTNISELMTKRRMYRRNRRNHLRYRKARFLNRKKDQTLAPSVNQKVNSHIKLINWVSSFLPITKIFYEGGSFDPHLLKNPDIKNYEYSNGEMYGYENVKAYCLERDHHTCAFNKNCSKVLHIHHIIEKCKGGSNNPSNLITLCEKHHKMLHEKKLELKTIKPKILKTATIMNIVNNQVLKRCPNLIETFGYLTKAKRIAQNLEKSHCNDAFVIAGGDENKTIYIPLRLMFRRKNNRCLQTNRNGFKPSIRKCRYNIQSGDIVKYDGKIFESKGITSKIYVILSNGIEKFRMNMKNVEVIFHSKTLIGSQG